jgi:CheY-like chemotaxis protein
LVLILHNAATVLLLSFVNVPLTNTQHQMGGKEAAAIIRKRNKRVPIIFLTGEIAASMKASTKQYAPAHLLLKPCSKKDLIAVS